MNDANQELEADLATKLENLLQKTDNLFVGQMMRLYGDVFVAALRQPDARIAREVALEAVLNVRAANAANFERKGAEWEAYDKAVLDCYNAIEAVMKEDQTNEPT